MQRTYRLMLGAAVLSASCAVPIETGPPIADPAATAARLLERSGAEAPAFVRFVWSYGDRRGDIDGEGAARYNPPDSLRLDLFTSGDVALSVSLADERLGVLGEIDDVEVPPRSFLFAMAGLFRPAEGVAPTGFESKGDTVLVYGEAARKLYFTSTNGRLLKVEERRDGHLERRVELKWSGAGAWPAQAEFRDFDQPSRVRWTIGATRTMETPHPTDIFLLDRVP
jgi:hypothetical protein